MNAVWSAVAARVPNMCGLGQKDKDPLLDGLGYSYVSHCAMLRLLTLELPLNNAT